MIQDQIVSRLIKSSKNKSKYLQEKRSDQMKKYEQEFDVKIEIKINKVVIDGLKAKVTSITSCSSSDRSIGGASC